MNKDALLKVLEGFPADEVRVDEAPGFVVTILAAQWNGVDEATRQKQIQSFLREKIGEADLRDIEFIIAKAPADKTYATLRALELRNNGEVAASANDAELAFAARDFDALFAHEWDGPLEVTAEVVSAPANSLAASYPLLEIEGAHFTDITLVDPAPAAAGAGRAAVPQSKMVRLRVGQAVQHM